ncbi:TPA: hypothetical protein ACH3X2_008201 [Trebouxia sp. C0005]
MLYVVKQLAVCTDVPALARILRTSAAGCFSVQRGRVVPTVTRKCLSSGQSAKLRIRTAATAAGPITVSTMPESAVQGLQPQALWDYFHDLTQIPRPSKFEDKVISYLQKFATQRKLDYKQDSTGNMVIRRPGSGGGEAAPTVVIQGHIDMVCEKNNDVQHDFHKDPLKLIKKGDWLKAEGTTLGADNGIGVAAALALLDMPTSAKLPPLECLFTIDEETGLTGAFGLDGSLLTGRTLLNLDTEDWGEIFIGCAGGGDSILELPVQLEPVPKTHSHPQELKISGLMGGHSGLNISEDRGNAVVLAALVLQAVVKAHPDVRIISLTAGDKRNAIAREASAILEVPSGEARLLVQQLVSQQALSLKDEYGHLERDMAIHVYDHPERSPTAMTLDSQTQLLTLLSTLPHGVIKWSHAVPGLVETSNNLAAVKPSTAGDLEATYTITCSTRSSLSHAMEVQRARIAAIAGLCGATVAQDKAYPGWAPNPSSPVLQVTKDAFQQLLGKEPKVAAIHAGLECGIIGEKVQGMDAVSYGPTITGAHSPDEQVNIGTVKPFWDVTLKILEALADKKQ